MMNGETALSGNGVWHEASASLLCATRETINLTNGESQCQSFYRTLDGGIHDFVRRKGVMESVNDVG